MGKQGSTHHRRHSGTTPRRQREEKRKGGRVNGLVEYKNHPSTAVIMRPKTQSPPFKPRVKTKRAMLAPAKGRRGAGVTFSERFAFEANYVLL